MDEKERQEERGEHCGNTGQLEGGVRDPGGRPKKPKWDLAE